jgi:Flp pilus assembly protein TadD
VPSAEHRSPGGARGPGFEARGLARQPESQPVPGVVSIARLQNAPPHKAVKEMRKGAKAAAEGDRKKAVEHYRRAVEIHPNYIEAYNNLGVQLMRLGWLDEAVAALEKAAELDPGSAQPHLNLSVALHAAGELEAAAYQAERAVELAPRSPEANLGLGLVLSAQGRDLEEALRRLRFAAREHPSASLAAADVLLELDRPREAQAALRSFLDRLPGPLK